MVKACVFFLAAIIFCTCPVWTRAAGVFESNKAAAQLYVVYLERNYFELEAQLVNFDPKDERREFFEGQLDAAFLHDKQAEEKLHRFLELPGMEADWRKEAWLTLGTSQLRDGDYEAAARDFAQALNEPSVRFTAPERIEAEQDLAMARALRGIPPQSCSGHEEVSTVNATRGRERTELGALVYIDARVNGLTEEAVFDTGANFSMASTSYAHRHQLRFLTDAVSFTNVAGAILSARVAVADDVRIGKMTFHHVIFGVLEDKELAFLSVGFNVSAVVGSPLIIPLGHLRMAPDGDSMEVGLPSNPDQAKSLPEHNLVFDRLLPLVQLQYQSKPLLFMLDTGMDRTFLFRRFGWRFPQALLGAGPSAGWRSSVDNSAVSSMQVIPRLELSVGKKSVPLSSVKASTEDRPIFPPVFGVIGEDFLANGFELDFRRMEFSLPEAK